MCSLNAHPSHPIWSNCINNNWLRTQIKLFYLPAGSRLISNYSPQHPVLKEPLLFYFFQFYDHPLRDRHLILHISLQKKMTKTSVLTTSPISSRPEELTKKHSFVSVPRVISRSTGYCLQNNETKIKQSSLSIIPNTTAHHNATTLCSIFVLFLSP